METTEALPTRGVGPSEPPRAPAGPPAGPLPLPAEVLAAVLGWLTPAEVARFGATSRAHHALAQKEALSLGRGRWLLAHGAAAVRAELEFAHRDCPGEPAAARARRRDFTEALLGHLASGRAEAAPARPAAWERRHVLRALYPVAVQGRWEFALPALEWCARLERAARGAGARPELLALLHRDALTRLEGLAAEREDCAARVFIAAARGFTRAAPLDWRGMTAALAALDALALAGLNAARADREGDVPLCHAIRCAARGAMFSVHGARPDWPLECLECGWHGPPWNPLDAAWAELAGLWPDAARCVPVLLAAFSCGERCRGPRPEG